MKICPTCHLRYPTDATHCFVDRTALEVAPDPYMGVLIAGKYQVDGVIGAGGMATVYRARHISSERTVAIKIFRRELASDARLRERFRREATSTRRLSHKNIIEILDEGETDDGTPFLVMEYLQGETLEAVLKRATGPLHLGRAIDINLQLTRGLARAHDFQVIHRDLKPDNLFLCPMEDGGDLVKVLDFGIARCMHDTRLTGTGEIFGTPQYMAPERITSIEAGPAADIYAVGCILFRCIAGRLPFVAGDVTGFLIQHLREAPPKPTQFNPEIPTELETLTLQCLQKDPARRPVDAHAVAKVLGELADVHPRPRRTSGQFPAVRPSVPPPAPVGSTTRQTGNLLSHASVERWERRAGLFDTMLERAYPKGVPPKAAALLPRIRASIARMSEVHAGWVTDQSLADTHAHTARDAQTRFGRAMDALGQDLSRARQQSLEAQEISQQYEDQAHAMSEPFEQLHAEVQQLGPIPTHHLVELYRASIDALEKAVAATEDLARAQEYAATRETEVRDLEFQIEALRTQLERVAQTGEDEAQKVRQRLETTGAEIAQIEQSLIRDASELASGLRGKQGLEDLFAALEAA